MGHAGQDVLAWIWEDVPSSNLRKGSEGKSEDVRERHGRSTGSVGRRPYSNATMHCLCHLALVSPFTILHYK